MDPKPYLEYQHWQWISDANHNITLEPRRARIHFRPPTPEEQGLWFLRPFDVIGYFTLYNTRDEVIQENASWIQYINQNGTPYMGVYRTILYGDYWIGWIGTPYPPPTYNRDDNDAWNDDHIHAMVDYSGNTWSIRVGLDGLFHYGPPEP